MARTSRVVGVHGINQHRHKPTDLTKTWSDALVAGLRAAGCRAATRSWTFELVYFADLLETRRADWKGPDDLAEIDPATEPEVAELLTTWLAALTDQEAPAAPEKGPVGVPATPYWVQHAVQRLAASPGLQDLGVTGVRRLARHLHAYLAHDEARRLIQATVTEQVGEQPVDVLIGHSMGSVVAYEWLHAAAADDRARVGTFLTLGSPLGIPPVASRLLPRLEAVSGPAPHGFRGQAPTACTRWVNAAGRHDPVAWPKRLAGIFGDRVEDVLVPTRVSAHAIRSYLGSAAVGALLRPALESRAV